MSLPFDLSGQERQISIFEQEACTVTPGSKPCQGHAWKPEREENISLMASDSAKNNFKMFS